VLPVNSPGGFGNRGGLGSAAGDAGSPPDGFADGAGGGGAGAIGGDVTSEGDKAGGAGLAYTIADGSTPVTYGAGGAGADGRVVVATSQFLDINTSMTLVSDTFTANSTPTTARIVVFAELPDGTSDFQVTATRDDSVYNAITLTDTGYVSGSSGTKIFTGSTPLTGTASPQVQMRWKITGTSLTGNNKIHGVSLQWK